MKTILPLLALTLLLGCSAEKGDAPIARGTGFGYDWTTDNPGSVLRVSVQNSFTRESYVALDGGGAHYELSVGPVRDGFMIVPNRDYQYSAWSFGKTVGNVKFDVVKDDRNGVPGVMIKIRP